MMAANEAVLNNEETLAQKLAGQFKGQEVSFTYDYGGGKERECLVTNVTLLVSKDGEVITHVWGMDETRKQVRKFHFAQCRNLKLAVAK